MLPLFSFPAVGPAVGGHCVVLNVNPALPWARGQLAAILQGSEEGLGAPQLLGFAGQREACLLQQPAQSYRHGFAGSCVW